MKFFIHVIPFVVALMTFWDFSIHVIDKRDRKYGLSGQHDKMWAQKLKGSNSFLSYYYPHFWGKNPTTDELAWRRYNYFWLTYWGLATILLVVYIVFR